MNFGTYEDTGSDRQVAVQTLPCPMCGKRQIVNVLAVDFAEFEKGEKSIHDCFPYLFADQRELFQTGYCPDCWDKLFSE